MSIGAALAFTTGGVFMQLSQGLTKPFPSIMIYLLFAIGAQGGVPGFAAHDKEAVEQSQ
jgi:hypothetical protein